MSTITDIKIDCSDAYQLAATLFTPASSIQLKAAVMIAPATGIKRGFYAAFAEYLAEQGYAVLTFNNRGIGDSLHGKVKDSNASLRDWGYLDMPAALQALIKACPDTKYHLIGHSAGGQLVGLMYNYDKISSMFNIACSSGQLDNMAWAYRIKAKFFMGVFAPLSNAIFSYTNTQWIGMGEPLPKAVAQEWCDWCNGAGYIATAFGKTVKEHWYDAIACPAIWLNASDDDIANDKNVDDMTRVFTRQQAERLRLEPLEQGLNEIGHMKFFSRKSKKLWPLATNWLDSHS